MDEAAKVHPQSWWWIKGDACDVVKGLGESVSGRWSGDVDLNDGSLEKSYANYLQRLKEAKEIGLPPRQDRPVVLADLETLSEQLSSDVAFITKGLLAVNCYQLNRFQSNFLMCMLNAETFFLCS